MKRLSPETLLAQSRLTGRATAREAEETDEVDGVRPRAVVEPDSAEALAALLAWASSERLSVVLRGSGTKLGWGRKPSDFDLLVSTRRLNRVLAHQHGDLTATVEGGATVGEVNRELARHGQWLPLDASFDDATIGGTIATADSGPLRQRHGTARDLLIGIHLATTDGRVVKAGGNVVKNVAGYDLGKLMSGSFGSLAAIVSATFKLAPLPTSSATVLAAFGGPDGLARAVAAVSSSQLEPVAFDVHVFLPPGSSATTTSASSQSFPPSFSPSYQLLAQFASTAEAVQVQVDEARRLFAADQFDVVSGPAEIDAWRGHRDLVWTAQGTAIKVSWLPAALQSVLGLIDEMARVGESAVALAGRAAVGAGVIRVDAGVTATVKAVELLRASSAVGNVVVLRAAPEVKAQADVWGAPRDTAALLRSVKRAFDPAGVLNAGRGPV